MADVLECYEVWDAGRGASERTQIDGSGPARTDSDLNRTFYIKTTADTVTQVKIFQEVQGSSTWPVPASGEPHPENPYMFALDFQLRAIGPTHWIMTVVYLSVGASENPLLEPPEESWTCQKWTAPVDMDYENAPILNAADESYDEPLQRQFTVLVLTRSVNLAAFDTGFWYPYIDTVNETASRGFPPLTGMIDSISAVSRTRGEVTYWRATIVVKYRNYVRVGSSGTAEQFGWANVVINKGFRLRKTSPSLRYEPIYDDGMPIRKPALLSADGSTRITDPSQATFREHLLYEVKNWGPTGIG